MHHAAALIATLALAGLATAAPGPQITAAPTVKIFFPLISEMDTIELQASVVTANADITTYAIRPAEADFDIAVATVAQGPSTYKLSASIGPNRNEMGCKLSSTIATYCTAVMTDTFGRESSTKVVTETLSSTVNLPFIPITITAGAEKLKNLSKPTETASASSGSESSSESSSGSSSGSDFASTLTGTVTPSATATASGTKTEEASGTQTPAKTSASTGGVPQATGSVGWIVGGAAAAMAVIAAI